MGPGRPKKNLLERACRFYPTFVTEEKNRVGVPVRQAAPMLAHIRAQLLQDMRTRAQLEASVSERNAITRAIALNALSFYYMRRGFDLSFYFGVAVPAAA